MRDQNVPLTPLTQPHTKTHIHSHAHRDKRKCGENLENHNENYNLRNEQPASACGGGGVNSGLLYFMPPHHPGPLDALSSFRTSITPFPAQRCLLAPPLPSHPLCEEDLNQRKPKQCTMDPPLPPMIQLWRERNMGEESDERESVGGGE